MISIIILVILMVQLFLTIKLRKNADKKIGLTFYILVLISMITFLIWNIATGAAFYSPKNSIISPITPIT